MAARELTVSKAKRILDRKVENLCVRAYIYIYKRSKVKFGKIRSSLLFFSNFLKTIITEEVCTIDFVIHDEEKKKRKKKINWLLIIEIGTND